MKMEQLENLRNTTLLYYNATVVFVSHDKPKFNVKVFSFCYELFWLQKHVMYKQSASEYLFVISFITKSV